VRAYLAAFLGIGSLHVTKADYPILVILISDKLHLKKSDCSVAYDSFYFEDDRDFVRGSTWIEETQLLVI
jgi:hypothetical protein